MPNQIDLPMSLLEKYDVQGPRYTSYPPVTSWSDTFTSSEYESLLSQSRRNLHPLSIYVHLPFCEELCLFCACTSIITGANHHLEEPYMETLFDEIDWVSAKMSPQQRVRQLHLGGGTPNYFSPEWLEKLMAELSSKFSCENEAELSIELDVRQLTRTQLEVFKYRGFNRLSLGIQDFDPHVQATIRRIQPFSLVENWVKEIRTMGFPSVNFDLVYGLPSQTVASFRKTMDRVISLSPDRLAVYSYAYVPWMKRYQERINQHQLFGREKLSLFLVAYEMLQEAGYEYIGMDHFAKPDDELSLARNEGTLWRNFQGYTTKAGTDLLGFGMSAISQVANGFSQNQRQWLPYQRDVKEKRNAVTKGYRCSQDDLIRARVIQGMMCQAEVRKSQIESEFGIHFDQYFKDALDRLSEMEHDGLVEMTVASIKPTRLGRLFLRNLALAFDATFVPSPGRGVFSRTV